MAIGFGVMRNVGSFRACNGEASPSITKLNDDLSFSSGPSPCSSHMTQIAEIGNELSRPPEDQSLGNAADSHQHYIPNFSNDSWNKSAFSGLRITRDNEVKSVPYFKFIDSFDNPFFLLGNFALTPLELSWLLQRRSPIYQKFAI